MADKLPCCLCDRETDKDDTMIFVVHLPKKVLLPPTSRGMVANVDEHTVTYSLCSQRCMSLWAMVISETSDPSSDLYKLTKTLSEDELKKKLEEAIHDAEVRDMSNMPKAKGNN